jgi:Spy/CpxP family protein refolding chaperone
MKRFVTIAVLALLVLGSSGAARAQEGPGPGGPMGDEKLERRLMTYWLMRITDELDLSDAQAQKIGDVMRKVQPQIAENRRTMMKSMRALRDADREGKVLPKAEVLALARKGMEARQTTEALRFQQVTEVSALLDDAKFQKFVALQAELMRDLMQRVRDVRGRWPGGGRFRDGGPDGPPPHPDEEP